MNSNAVSPIVERGRCHLYSDITTVVVLLQWYYVSTLIVIVLFTERS